MYVCKYKCILFAIDNYENNKIKKYASSLDVNFNRC